MPADAARILVSESVGFSPRAAELLRQSGSLILADLDRPSLLSEVGAVDVLWTRLRHQIDAEVLHAARRLKLIISPTTGLNHIDLDEAERLGVHIVSLRGETEFLQEVRGTAEHTIALSLALLRHIPAACTHILEGGWNRDLFKGHELMGKVVGVVGYGRLGRIVARYLKVFGAEILTSSPHLGADSVEQGVKLVALRDLLSESDLVTLHVNLNQETRGFFGAAEFSHMKMGAWFVNTSRGELIDESALLDALRFGRVAGAALDVLCDERSAGMGHHPLVAYARAHENLIITPHLGGCTVESMEKAELFLAGKFSAQWQRSTLKSIKKKD